MNKKIGTLLVLAVISIVMVYAFEPVAASENSWTPKAPMIHARAYFGAAAIEGKIYVIGGDGGGETGCCMPGTSMTNNAVNYTEEYDPAINQWSEKASMPTPRALFGTAVYGNKIYCIGGYNGAFVRTGPEVYDWKTQYYSLGTNEVYDPVTDTWATASSMPTPRHSAATNIVDGKIYVIGGNSMDDLNVTYNLTEVYDPQTNSWSTKTPSPLPVTSSASAVVDGKIYVLGANPYPNWKKSIEIYDPSADVWEIKGETSLGYAATAAATSGVNALKRIYFFDSNRTDIYNPYNDSWTVGAPAPANRIIPKAIAADDLIYLVGGRSGELGHIVIVSASTLNEQYFPVGYGTPDLSTPTPAPTPTPSPSPTPTLVAQNGNATEPIEQTQPNSQLDSPLPIAPIAIAAAATISIVAGSILFWIKKHP